jgi:hypothetical protein
VSIYCDINTMGVVEHNNNNNTLFVPYICTYKLYNNKTNENIQIMWYMPPKITKKLIELGDITSR